MITFSGRLNRSSYWKIVVLSLIGLVIASGILLWLLDLQNAEISGASSQNQILAVIFGILYLVSLIVYFVVMLSAIIRRARDTGSFVLWMLIALLLPFRLLIIGLVLSQK